MYMADPGGSLREPLALSGLQPATKFLGLVFAPKPEMRLRDTPTLGNHRCAHVGPKLSHPCYPLVIGSYLSTSVAGCLVPQEADG